MKIVREPLGHVAVFHLSADECEGIAAALGMDDAGGREMKEAAEAIRIADDEDGVS